MTDDRAWFDSVAADEPPAPDADGVRPDAAQAQAAQTPTVAPGDPLRVYSVAQARAELAHRGPRTFLFRGLWPTGAPGVQSATRKALKSLTACAAAVSAASGRALLGLFDVQTPGPVVMFVGEGDLGEVVQRLDAVCGELGLRLDALAISIVTRVPVLNDPQQLARMTAIITEIQPVLVVLDPLYLAAAGAKGADLYGMGEVLLKAQDACRASGSALWVCHHNNRSRLATGADRISGAGPAEWARVIITAEELSRSTDLTSRATTVTLQLEIITGQGPDLFVKVTRRVWRDDQDNLDSALRLETTAELLEAPVRTTGANGDGSRRMSASEQAVRGALLSLAHTGDYSTAAEIGERVEKIADRKFSRPTITRQLAQLVQNGLVDELSEAPGVGAKKRWRWAGV